MKTGKKTVLTGQEVAIHCQNDNASACPHCRSTNTQVDISLRSGAQMLLLRGNCNNCNEVYTVFYDLHSINGIKPEF